MWRGPPGLSSFTSAPTRTSPRTTHRQSSTCTLIQGSLYQSFIYGWTDKYQGCKITRIRMFAKIDNFDCRCLLRTLSNDKCPRGPGNKTLLLHLDSPGRTQLHGYHGSILYTIYYMLYTTSNYNSGIPNFGVSHADDLFYLWNPLLQTDYSLNGKWRHSYCSHRSHSLRDLII